MTVCDISWFVSQLASKCRYEIDNMSLISPLTVIFPTVDDIRSVESELTQK